MILKEISFVLCCFTGPVEIWNRVGPQYPLACRKRQPNGGGPSNEIAKISLLKNYRCRALQCWFPNEQNIELDVNDDEFATRLSAW